MVPGAPRLVEPAAAGQIEGRASRRTSAVSSWPDEIYRALGELGVRQVAYVPDAGHARLIELCQQDPAVTTVVLTTEEEGIGLLAGAWLGGQRGVLLMQSSGVGNCINMLALNQTCRLPLLMLVTMRGEWGEFNPWQLPMGQSAPAALAVAGVLTERLSEPAAAYDTVRHAGNMAFEAQVPLAVLLSQRLIGAKSFLR
jgi:sulfopyruvate decarboxylase alpha subunit